MMKMMRVSTHPTMMPLYPRLMREEKSIARQTNPIGNKTIFSSLILPNLMKYSWNFCIQDIQFGKISNFQKRVFAKRNPMIKAQTEAFTPASEKCACFPKICETRLKNTKKSIPKALKSSPQALEVI